jgi:hypothetical protein
MTTKPTPHSAPHDTGPQALAKARKWAATFGWVMTVTITAAMLFTLATVTTFALRHDVGRTTAWMLDPMLSGTLVLLLKADSYLAGTGAGRPASKWPGTLEILCGLGTWTVNVWSSVYPPGTAVHLLPQRPDPAGIVLHSLPPALIIVASRCQSVYQAHFAALINKLQRDIETAEDKRVARIEAERERRVKQLAAAEAAERAREREERREAEKKAHAEQARVDRLAEKEAERETAERMERMRLQAQAQNQAARLAAEERTRQAELAAEERQERARLESEARREAAEREAREVELARLRGARGRTPRPVAAMPVPMSSASLADGETRSSQFDPRASRTGLANGSASLANDDPRASEIGVSHGQGDSRASEQETWTGSASLADGEARSSRSDLRGPSASLANGNASLPQDDPRASRIETRAGSASLASGPRGSAAQLRDEAEDEAERLLRAGGPLPTAAEFGARYGKRETWGGDRLRNAQDRLDAERLDARQTAAAPRPEDGPEPEPEPEVRAEDGQGGDVADGARPDEDVAGEVEEMERELLRPLDAVGAAPQA